MLGRQERAARRAAEQQAQQSEQRAIAQRNRMRHDQNVANFLGQSSGQLIKAAAEAYLNGVRAQEGYFQAQVPASHFVEASALLGFAAIAKDREQAAAAEAGLVEVPLPDQSRPLPTQR